MNFKKIICAVLALTLLLGGCRTELSDLQGSVQGGLAASSAPEEQEADFEPVTAIRIPYDEEDGLSPYACKTVANRYICGLIYGSLVALNPDFSPALSAAERVAPSAGNTVWEIALRQGLRFPDGSALTADDLLYSILQARAGGSYYESSLESVAAAVKSGDYAVTVTLSAADRYFENLLVFPLIKNGTVAAPVALPGRYALSGDGTSLLCNSGAAVRTVELVKLADHGMLLQEMRLGVYDIIYSDDPAGISVTSVGGMETMPTTNLVYIGMNSGRALLSGAGFRRALSLAVDAESLCEEVYRGYAEPARGPFSPVFYDAAGLEPYPCDLQAANQALDELGYENRSAGGYRLAGQSELSLGILVCADAEEKAELAKALAETVESLGIHASVTALPYKNYLAALEGGSYDLYLAEVRLGADMDLTKLVAMGGYAGGLCYGAPASEALRLSWFGYEGGTAGAAAFREAFDAVTPFLPVCYRQSAAVYSRDFYFEIGATEQDLFHGILNWGSRGPASSPLE